MHNGGQYTQSISEQLSNCMPRKGLIRQYLEWAHKTSHTPPLYHLASILPSFAYETTRRGFKLRLEGVEGKSATRKMHIWTALVGDSSTGKSTATKTARSFLQDFGKASFGDRYRYPFLHAEGSVQGVLHALCEDDFFVPEIQETAALLHIDEFARLTWQESAATAFCMLFDGETFERHLRGLQKEGKTAIIRNPTISACFAGTGRSLEQYVNAEHIEGGLFARILWFTDKVPPDKLMFSELPFEKERQSVMREWQAWNQEMLAAQALGKASEVTIDGNSLSLIEEMLFEPFREKYVEDQRLAPIRMRMLSHVRTIAGLYALSSGSRTIEQDDMVAAINLVRLCDANAEKITETLGVPREVAFRNKILQHIHSFGAKGASTSDLYRRLPSDIRNQSWLSEALDLLLTVGEIISVKSIGVGRPSMRFIHREFTTVGQTTVNVNTH